MNSIRHDLLSQLRRFDGEQLLPRHVFSRIATGSPSRVGCMLKGTKQVVTDGVLSSLLAAMAGARAAAAGKPMDAPYEFESENQRWRKAWLEVANRAEKAGRAA